MRLAWRDLARWRDAPFNLTGASLKHMAKRDPQSTARDWMPEHPTLPKLREAAAGCRACDLYKTGTQTVFGEGPSKAGIMFIGEIPGDAEDQEGKPFVGPAGKLFDRLLGEAGIDRKEVYATNALTVTISVALSLVPPLAMEARTRYPKVRGQDDPGTPKLGLPSPICRSSGGYTRVTGHFRGC